AVRIARIDNFEMFEDLDPQVEVVRTRLIRVRPHAARAEPRTRTIRGAEVERRTDDRNVGGPLGKHLRVRHQRPLRKSQRATKDVTEFKLFAIPGRQLTLHPTHAKGSRRGAVQVLHSFAPRTHDDPHEWRPIVLASKLYEIQTGRPEGLPVSHSHSFLGANRDEFCTAARRKPLCQEQPEVEPHDGHAWHEPARCIWTPHCMHIGASLCFTAGRSMPAAGE
ncbi:MAG: hypothetical protein RL743_1251, partial [Actinomycetota bacterium]